jgi:hypothetical protein
MLILEVVEELLKVSIAQAEEEAEEEEEEITEEDTEGDPVKQGDSMRSVKVKSIIQEAVMRSMLNKNGRRIASRT